MSEMTNKITEWLDGGCSSWGVPSLQIASLVEENKRMREALNTIEALIGNVDHSRGGGENTARLYGGMLNDIRTIAGDTNA